MIKRLRTARAYLFRAIMATTLMAGLSLPAYAQPDDLKQCTAAAIKAGLPSDLGDAMYLMEWNSPAPLVGIACQAALTGVRFRYLAGGLIRKDSIQLKGKSSLRIWVKSHTMEAEQLELLVPVEYELNGKSFPVTRNNIQVLAMHLRNTLNNE